MPWAAKPSSSTTRAALGPVEVARRWPAIQTRHARPRRARAAPRARTGNGRSNGALGSARARPRRRAVSSRAPRRPGLRFLAGMRAVRVQEPQVFRLVYGALDAAWALEHVGERRAASGRTVGGARSPSWTVAPGVACSVGAISRPAATPDTARARRRRARSARAGPLSASPSHSARHELLRGYPGACRTACSTCAERSTRAAGEHDLALRVTPAPADRRCPTSPRSPRWIGRTSAPSARQSPCSPSHRRRRSCARLTSPYRRFCDGTPPPTCRRGLVRLLRTHLGRQERPTRGFASRRGRLR